MRGRGFWTWETLGGQGGSESEATWKSGHSAATRAADLTGGRGDYTAEGGGAHGPGAVRLPSLKYHPERHEQCLRFLRTSDQGTSVRTSGMMSGRRQVCWLTRLLGCSRTSRTSELRTGCCEHRGFLSCVPLVPLVPLDSAYPSTGGVHNDESTTVWWDDQLGTVPTGF